jgi:CBS domain-containing protein
VPPKFLHGANAMTVLKAMISQPISLKPDATVKDAVDLFIEKKIRGVPVVDDNNILLGTFTLRRFLSFLLPVSAQMEDGLESLDFLGDTTPAAAKKT